MIISNIQSEFDDKKCLHILQKELMKKKLLSKYSLQTNELDYSFVIKCLKICYELSEVLRKKLNQKEIKIHNKNNIQRCSYKFCNLKKTVIIIIQKNHFCYQDHYVHNMVSHDLTILINILIQMNLKILIKMKV